MCVCFVHVMVWCVVLVSVLDSFHCSFVLWICVLDIIITVSTV